MTMVETTTAMAAAGDTTSLHNSPAPHELEFHTHHDPHRQASTLSDVILGGQDGLVNVLGIALGVAAATQDPRIILAAGMAATFAESVSMAAVAYTSRRADQDYYESEREREYRHLRMVPAVEREEIREIYASKGFRGETLERIVSTITANEDVWVGVMMAEEHQLTPVGHAAAAKSALIVGTSAVIGSLIPLMPFVLLPVTPAMATSMLVAAVSLFGIGAYKATRTVGRPGRSGLEMALIGTASALVGYVVGLMFKVPPA
ncbi:MAG TPA: VIT1/CCC1 transporter family protein [Anaerolineales bacterium]|nr:VIT1/CCC1 transporter family protein [Anaerolineales bacterium]